MPIITEPEKLSMPQQVQKNKEDIESIFKKIDGLDSLDNVVVVSDMSYILTADELKSVRQPVAFIVYNNQLFIKKKEENGNAYFNLVFSITVSTVVSFESKQIEVNLTNGALGLTSSTVSTYSVSQIDSKFPTALYVDNALAQKASLTGANFTGAITAPSIIENMSGYSFVKVESFSWNSIYSGACRNGNKITFVIFGDITKNDTYNAELCHFLIPNSVGEKLYPYTKGGINNVLYNNTLNIFPNTSITSEPKTIYFDIGKSGNTRINFNLRNLNTLDSETVYQFRIEVTFLLSDNLAQ